MIATLKTCLIIILLFTGIVTSQYFFDIRNTQPPEYPITVLPPTVIKMADFGFNSAAASFLWLNIIQRIGAFLLYDKFDEDINLITDIDPKFSYPYAFAELLLYDKDPGKAIEIGKKGLANAAPDWRIPFYLGFVYHFKFNDRENTLKYFDIASQTPGAPENIKFMAISYGTTASRREQTKQIWLTIYQTSSDDVIKERALTYIEHYSNLDLLDKAINEYKKIKKTDPATIDDLVTSGILKEIPIDPFGFKYNIASDGKAEIKFQ